MATVISSVPTFSLRSHRKRISERLSIQTRVKSLRRRRDHKIRSHQPRVLPLDSRRQMTGERIRYFPSARIPSVASPSSKRAYIVSCAIPIVCCLSAMLCVIYAMFSSPPYASVLRQNHPLIPSLSKEKIVSFHPKVIRAQTIDDFRVAAVGIDLSSTRYGIKRMVTC